MKNKKLVLWMGIWAAVAVILPDGLIAASRLIVMDEKGVLHELVPAKKNSGPLGRIGVGNSPATWKTVDEKELRKPGFQVSDRIRVTADKKGVEVNNGGSWSNPGINPPPGAITYERAVIDPSGNIAIELGGNGKGFNFRFANGTFVPAFKVGFEGGNVPPPLVGLTSIPGSNSFFGLSQSSGQLFRVTPPTPPAREFKAEVAGNGTYERVVAVGDKVYALSKQGLFELQNASAPFASSIQEAGLVLPDGMKSGTFEVFTNADSPDSIQTMARNQKAASAQTVAASRAQVESVNPDPASAGTDAPTVAGSASETVDPAAANAAKTITNRSGPNAGSGGVAKKTTLEELDDICGKMIGKCKNWNEFLSGMDGIINDNIGEDIKAGKAVDIFGRDKEADRVLDTFARLKNTNPVLMGEAGVGKTEVARRVTQMLMDGDLPPGSEFQKLQRGIVIQATAGKISALAKSNDNASQMKAMEDFLIGVRSVQEATKRPIILFIDEMHTLNEAQRQALKTSLEGARGIYFFGASTHDELNQVLKHDEAFSSRLNRINVREFTPEETLVVLKKSWVPVFEKRYNVKIEDEAVKAAIRLSIVNEPNDRRVRGPLKMLQDVVVRAHRTSKGALTTITPRNVGEYVIDVLGGTLNPFDREAFAKQVDNLREVLREDVVDQHRVTDKMVELYQQIAKGTGKSHRTILVPGPTGAGKTFSGQRFAKHVLGDEQRLLEIDATKYATGGSSLNTLIGGPLSHVGTDKTSGVLPDFLTGKGKGRNVIVINEVEKAHPDFMQAIMEMLDTGYLTGGDGKRYYLGQSLIVLTTNKGDEYIYPRGTGKALSRAEIDARLDKMDDKAIRQLFLQPDPKNLYDTSKQLTPAILQRIDAAVPAAPPSYEGAQKIVRQQLEKSSKEYLERFGVQFEMDDDVVKYLVDTKYVPEDGVRDLVRTVAKVVEAADDQAGRKLGDLAGKTLKMKLLANADHTQIVVTDAGTDVASFEAPKIDKLENPLIDPSARQKLAGLEERLGNHVFGQPEAVSTAAKSIRTRAVNPRNPKPATTLDLGQTGVGKTELSKAIARELFGDENRMISFDMGKVKWEGALNNIFGSDTGITGSDKMSPFEKFLVKFPEGGVINFDEIGNMGGGSTHYGEGGGANSKEDLLKVFYTMLDEGKWTSPHGTVYDLRKYVIRFTSNEGQELFKDLPSDDLRMAAWKEGSKKEKILDLLVKKHKWPEPLVARLRGNVTLYRPATAEIRERIAKKLVHRTIDDLQKQHGIKKVTFDEGFYKTVGDSFFSHSQGARAMDALTETELTDLFTQSLFDSYDPETLKKSTMHFSLKDTYAGRFSYSGKYKLPDERQVILSLKVSAPGLPDKTFEVDVANQAAVKRLSSRKDALMSALHEAGHALVNDPKQTGLFVDFVTIRGQGDYGGYARYDKVPGFPGTLNRQQVIASIGKMLAGGEMEKRWFGPAELTTGRSSDIESARQMAEAAVTNWGLAEDPLALPVKDGKVIVTDRRVQSEINKLLREGEDYANRRIDERWPTIRALSGRLMAKGHIDKAEFDALVTNTESPAYLEAYKKLKARNRTPTGWEPSAKSSCSEAAKNALMGVSKTGTW